MEVEAIRDDILTKKGNFRSELVNPLRMESNRAHQVNKVLYFTLGGVEG